jgi:hypothetical protein
VPARRSLFRRHRLVIGGVAGLAVLAVAALLITRSGGPNQADHGVTAAPGPSLPVIVAPPVRRTGTVDLTAGDHLDLDSAAGDWNRGTAPDPGAHDVTFSASLHTVLSDDAGAMMVLAARVNPGYAACMYGTYGHVPAPDELRPGAALCVTTEFGRRALVQVVAVHRDSVGHPDRLSLRITVWQAQPDPVEPPPPARPRYDRTACASGTLPDGVTMRPAEPRAAGWFSSRPIPWGAPECLDQIWWAPYVNGGAHPAVAYTWTFDTGLPGATCTLWADYPPPPSGHSAGIAHYSVDDGTRQLAYFPVAQAGFMGRWHGLGGFTFTSGQITVTLDNSGDYANPEQGVIAGPLRLECR